MRGLYLLCFFLFLACLGLTQTRHAGRFDKHFKDIKTAFRKQIRADASGSGYTPHLCGAALFSHLIYLGLAMTQRRPLTVLSTYCLLWYWVMNVYVQSFILLVLGVALSVVVSNIARALEADHHRHE